ncbi:MAG: diadenylate cyclase [Acidobacteriota bacterium]|nr:diadenylate cyclase [Acidobacteriota bacterium]
MTDRSPRLRRLADELAEIGLPAFADRSLFDLVVEEADHALRPRVHERRVVGSGAIVGPTTESTAWGAGTALTILRIPVKGQPLEDARRFADGLSSWLVRRAGGDHEWLMFDRPAGSERDLVVLADTLGATLVQRHPSGTVRIVGRFGVLRTEGFDWHHEPPVEDLAAAVADPEVASPEITKALLEFAVHDLGAGGLGAVLVLRPGGLVGPGGEQRLPSPPALRVGTPFHLAPLRHALGQVDGAAVFDEHGVLRQLGVRLVPSPWAEREVAPLGGTRHTSARRYSYDEPQAVVVAVSEDGPVTVFRRGSLVGRSLPDSEDGQPAAP